MPGSERQFFSDSPDGTSLLKIDGAKVPGVKGNTVFAVVQFEYTTWALDGKTDMYGKLPSPIAVLTPADVGVSAAVLSHRKRLEVTGLTYPRPRPKRIFTPDSGQPAGERIKQIMSAGLARRRSRILEGPPREIAAELVKLLRRHKII